MCITTLLADNKSTIRIRTGLQCIRISFQVIYAILILYIKYAIRLQTSSESDPVLRSSINTLNPNSIKYEYTNYYYQGTTQYPVVQHRVRIIWTNHNPLYIWLLGLSLRKQVSTQAKYRGRTSESQIVTDAALDLDYLRDRQVALSCLILEIVHDQGHYVQNLKAIVRRQLGDDLSKFEFWWWFWFGFLGVGVGVCVGLGLS